MPATTNAKIQIFAGNKATLRFTVRNGDLPEVGGQHPVFDLTGFTVRWALSRGNNSKYSTEADILKSSALATEIEITDAPNGALDVKLVGADTVDIFGDFYQELELVDGASETLVVARGEVEILQNVSNVAS